MENGGTTVFFVFYLLLFINTISVYTYANKTRSAGPDVFVLIRIRLFKMFELHIVSTYGTGTKTEIHI
jgi:hypothetical protein